MNVLQMAVEVVKRTFVSMPPTENGASCLQRLENIKLIGHAYNTERKTFRNSS